MKENKKKTIGEEIINMLKYIEFEVDELIKKFILIIAVMIRCQ